MERPEAYQKLETIYGELGDELDRLRPRCELSGRCCKFKEYDHQLWTTPIEIDYLIENVGLPEKVDHAVCPWLAGGKCSVRDHRMLGCRIFFCDPAYEEAMGPLYEKYHQKVKELHREADVDYEYVEFIKSPRLVKSPPPEAQTPPQE